MKKYNVFSMFVFLLLAFAVNGWASCATANLTRNIANPWVSTGSTYSCNNNASADYGKLCEAYAGQCAPTFDNGSGRIYIDPVLNIEGTDCPSTRCVYSSRAGSWAVGCRYRIYCTTQAEADSIICENKSGWKWENGQCVDHNCTQPDSTWGACATYFKTDDDGNLSQVSIKNTFTRTSCETSSTAEIVEQCPQDLLPPTDSTACDTNGGFWYDEKCNATPKQCEERADACSSFEGQFSVKSINKFAGVCYYECVKPDTLQEIQSVELNEGDDGQTLKYGIRTSYPMGSVTNYVTKEAYDYLDSLMGVKCENALYRGIKNGRYVYWYSGQPIPAGVTSVVKMR